MSSRSCSKSTLRPFSGFSLIGLGFRRRGATGMGYLPHWEVFQQLLRGRNRFVLSKTLMIPKTDGTLLRGIRPGAINEAGLDPFLLKGFDCSLGVGSTKIDL